MDLKSAHSQESDFQESGEVDRFLKMGTHFQERSGSLENGLCVTWSGFWLCPVAFDTCCSGANLLPDHTPTRSTESSASSPSDSESNSKLSTIEVIDVNDGAY